MNYIYTFKCSNCESEWDENKKRQISCPECSAYYENAEAIKKHDCDFEIEGGDDGCSGSYFRCNKCGKIKGF
jgi:uncharacterized Zn ribbon protein